MATPPVQPYIDPENSWRAYLEGPGGETNAIGDYSTGETIFEAKIAGGGTYILERIDMAMGYNGQFDVFNYGIVASPGLAVGVRLRVMQSGGSTRDLDAGQAIKTNFAWAHLATGGGALQPSDSPAQNQDGFYGIGLELARIAKPMALRAGDSVQIVLNDDLTSLLAHTFIASGYKTNRYP